jgi:hypothetical protein
MNGSFEGKDCHFRVKIAAKNSVQIRAKVRNHLRNRIFIKNSKLWYLHIYQLDTKS